jgi:molybdopterin-guanine dinucleotide biosynthesis protein A
MNNDIKKHDITAVILSGGRLDESLREYGNVPSKGFIEIAGKPMVVYVIDTLKKIDRVNKIILVSNPEHVTPDISSRVDKVVPGGETMIQSLRSAIDKLESQPEYLLVLPCDMPLITPEAVNDFIDQSLTPPVDITYAYLSREDSESAYPDAKHTYVTIREGTFCGSGLFMMKPGMIEACESLFRKLTGNRKNPFALVSILGPAIVLKFLLKTVTVRELENRMSKLMGGCLGRGIRTRYADAAFNVDAPGELLIARRLLEKQA